MTDRRVARLLSWYRTHARDLPWRRTRDAYRIFISELMLQQTQVDRVIPLYARWLAVFPSWASLARAKTASLIHAWAGLGYNRRALYAREAAQTVGRDGIPSDESEWRRLKGVGPYMAAALAEFVNGQRAIVIDTNVRRVAGRLFLGKAFPSLVDDPRIRERLEIVTPKQNGHRELPQAFMDLGSAICLPRNPTCAACPLRAQCLASPKFLSGRAGTPKRRTNTERIHRDKPFPDRIYRGRILSHIRKLGPDALNRLGPHIDPTFDPIADQAWIEAMCRRLAKDGFLVIGKNGILSLPHS